MRAPAPELLAQITERDWLAKVVQNAKVGGWLVYHTWRSDHSAKGFPDLVLVKPPRLLFVELKKCGKRPDVAQVAWLSDLDRCTEVSATWWTPADWQEMERTLLGAA